MFRRARRTMVGRITIRRRGHDMSVHLAIRDATTERKGGMATVVFAGSVGTIIEWYDFLIYGTAAALVFNTLFFPNIDPLAGTLASLATYSVGFVARPIGGAIFGHFGDRIGRKIMLMITMVIMALGTFVVGCLPTYQQIGVWAPILLVILRLIQGIGLGGEWGGASLMVIEHAPAGRRGLFGSLVQIGFPLGLVTSSGVFALVTMMPEADFKSWGWRIPFLLSILLLGVGWFVRARVPETPIFEEIKRRGAISRNPFVEAILKNPRSFLVAVGLKISEVSWVYILTIFIVVYATNQLNLPRTLLLNAIFVAALVEVITIPLFGWLSDHLGRRNRQRDVVSFRRGESAVRRHRTVRHRRLSRGIRLPDLLAPQGRLPAEPPQRGALPLSAVWTSHRSHAESTEPRVNRGAKALRGTARRGVLAACALTPPDVFLA